MHERDFHQWNFSSFNFFFKLVLSCKASKVNRTVFVSMNHLENYLKSMEQKRLRFVKEQILFRERFQTSQPWPFCAKCRTALLSCTHCIMKRRSEVGNPKHPITSKLPFQPSFWIHLFFQRISFSNYILIRFALIWIPWIYTSSVACVANTSE